MIDSIKPSILLVDDEPDILFSVRSLLRKDFEVYTAESGRNALEMLATLPVQVMVTDQRMPEMTGSELLRRAHELRADVVGIMFTGYSDLKGVVEAINHGRVFRYLTKPWDPDDLIGTLNDAVAHHDRLMERRRLLSEAYEVIGELVESGGRHRLQPPRVRDDFAPSEPGRIETKAKDLLERLRTILTQA